MTTHPVHQKGKGGHFWARYQSNRGIQETAKALQNNKAATGVQWRSRARHLVLIASHMKDDMVRGDGDLERYMRRTLGFAIPELMKMAEQCAKRFRSSTAMRYTDALCRERSASIRDFELQLSQRDHLKSLKRHKRKK